MPEPHRYQDPKLQNHLASRYVVGKMHGRAKIRFEKLINVNDVMARRVKQWEAKMEQKEAQTELELRAILPRSASKLVSSAFGQKDTSMAIKPLILRTLKNQQEKVLKRQSTYKYLFIIALSTLIVLSIMALTPQ
jgi:hypothetical protein